LPDTVIGPDAEIAALLHRPARPRTRVAAVIGTATSPPNAHSITFGYTIWNDMSARDTQQRLPVGMGPQEGLERQRLAPASSPPTSSTSATWHYGCGSTARSGEGTARPTCTSRSLT
jgi:2-keto-4-pentenoate hydratase/2-oxohepta-3-ene-1,7-dioic acid hydratase in catechol pathway